MHDEFRPAADGSTEPALEYGRYEEVLRRNLPYIEDRPLTGDSVLADLGLDSLGTVRLLAELEEAFGQRRFLSGLLQLGVDLLLGVEAVDVDVVCDAA
ncbi:acyl carrier protein, partial [Streptomyces sp. NPDC002519]